MPQMKKDLIGACGLFCGLCAKYQSKAKSRCIGCKQGEQHSWYSIWNCCVMNHGFETCVECNKIFDCEIFIRRKVAEWIPASDNLRQIKENGLETWLLEQNERQALLELLLEDYNEGRSMNFFCKICAGMPPYLINKALEEAKEKLADDKIDKSEMKLKAKVFKTIVKKHLSVA